jgi:hypothetical protein
LLYSEIGRNATRKFINLSGNHIGRIKEVTFLIMVTVKKQSKAYSFQCKEKKPIIILYKKV